MILASETDDALNTLRENLGLPRWLIGTLTVLLALRVLYKPLAEAVVPPYKFFINHVLPLVYTPERRAKVRERQMFAHHVEAEIRRHNAKEDWADHRFAELEAEVEVEDSHRFGSLARLLIYDLFAAAEHTARLRKQREEEAAKKRFWKDVYFAWVEIRRAYRYRKGRLDTPDSSWPEFRTPFFREWLEQYLRRNKDKMLWFGPDVTDEMSRIIEDVERAPTYSYAN